MPFNIILPPVPSSPQLSVHSMFPPSHRPSVLRFYPAVLPPVQLRFPHSVEGPVFHVMLHSNHGRREEVQAPSKGGPAKNLCSKSKRKTVSCRVTWGLSERVNCVQSADNGTADTDINECNIVGSGPR
jgi:hypothetical protein